jgi:hypothetical protein
VTTNSRKCQLKKKRRRGVRDSNGDPQDCQMDLRLICCSYYVKKIFNWRVVFKDRI